MPCCCGDENAKVQPSCGDASVEPGEWFDRMIGNCLDYANRAKAEGRPIVCIMCEFTPRELIMAADGLAVCLCGGSAETIPAAEEHLPANLCPLIKSTFGYHVRKSNPFLEMSDLVVGETTCDGKKKMYELMAESRPMIVLELPQRSDDAQAFEHWVRELGKFRADLQERFSVEITDDKLRQAIRVMNRERALRRELAEMMQAARPPMTGLELLAFKSTISGNPADFEQYEKAIAAFRRKSAGATACDGSSAGLVRVLMTGVPMVHGTERVLRIIEEVGGLVVATENCTGLKPILEDVGAETDDPLRALAEKYYHLPCSVMTPNQGRMDVLRQLSADYRPDCVVELIWQACLTYDVEAHRVRRLATEELGIPYLRIETDYSPSDSARIATRIEALLETVRAGA